MPSSLILLFLVLGVVTVVSLIVMAINSLFKPTADRRLKKMVEEERRNYGENSSSFAQAGQFISNKLKPLARFSAPEGPWDVSPLRRKLMAAGYRSPSAGMAYLGLKTLLTLLLPILFLALSTFFKLSLDSNQMLLFVLIFSALGYMLPNFILSFLVSRRRRELYENFPDALDLMRICVEAGLALDVAISRVGEEMRMRSTALSDEFRLVVLEQRAGSARSMALNNLAMRVGIQDVDALVATLVQADKFGTSIADSLRVHSDNLRLGRRLRAEEQAAKIPTKILLPLILCIFPLLFIFILFSAIGSIRHSFGFDFTASTESEQSP
ncbi:MAG: type II secretion system F family protein [Ferrovum sp.]|nr:type II secretion system F family protein [Ferrovum sp.]